MEPETQIIDMPEGGKPNLGPDEVPDNGDLKGLVEYCMDLLEQFKKSEYRSDKVDEIKESRTTYEQKEDPRKQDFPWKEASNITMPLNTITVDNLEPRLVAGLVGTKPIVRMEIEGVQEQDDQTKIVEAWFNQELESKVEIETKTMAIVHNILLEGTVYYIPKYDRKEKKKKDFMFDQMGRIVVGPDAQPVIIDKVESVFEGGAIENIPFTDIYCADDIGTPEQWESADKIRIIRPTYGDLMRNKNSVGYLPDKIGPWLCSHKNKGELKEEEQTASQSLVDAKYTGKETIECGEFYITYHINKDEEAEEKEQDDFTEDQILATIHLETKTIIRLCSLRDLNFENESLIKRIRLFPEETRSYGTSIYGKIKSVQNGSSDFFNAILNISYIVMLPWFFYDDNSGMRGEIEIIPGKGIQVENVKGILFPNFNVNPPVYLPFIEMFIQLWERIGSVANPQIGRPSDTDKTATEIMMVVQEGNIKFDYQSRTLKQEFLSIIKTLYDLYYQHMPYDTTFNYNGQMLPMPRQLMKQGYKFRLVGSTALANKMLERKESEDLYGMALQQPMMNIMTAIEEVLKSRGKTDLSRWLNPQARALVEALKLNPEIASVVGNYLNTKAETEAEIGSMVEDKNAPRAPIAISPAMPGATGGTV